MTGDHAAATPGRFMRRLRRSSVAVVAIVLLAGFTRMGDDLVEVGRGLDLFGAIYRTLSLNYVDRLEPMMLARGAIKGMLGTLDPYTVFVEAQDKVDVDMLTTGSYGGIGMNVSVRKGHHIVTGFLDSVAWNSTGLRIGDEILRIDTTNVTGLDKDLKIWLRGRPGSTVRLTIRRPTESSTRVLAITRRDVPVRSLAHAELLKGGIAYIRLDRFTRTAAEDVRSAYKSFASDGAIHGIILDLRDNPGGLLETAVGVADKFLPRGSVIVSTRGRMSQYSKPYLSEEEPVDTQHPLVVLVNGSSASASEIVAGAIQDYDRGLIIGSPTFGKGLVQSVIPVGSDASLKITTSKYYTPSGRCIQKLTYGGGDNSPIIPDSAHDSTRWYRTIILNRTVRGAGGIEPDLQVAADTGSRYVNELVRNYVIFDFVTVTVNRDRLTAVPAIDERMKREFRKHLDTLSFHPDMEVRKAYDALSESVRVHGYDSRLQGRLRALEPELRIAQGAALDRNWEEVKRRLEVEFALHTGGRTARIARVIPFDPQVRKAVELLLDPRAYSAAFSAGK